MVPRRRRAVFLDRDGVLNQVVVRNGKPCPPDDVEHLELFADVPGALADLSAAGFLLICVTNQPDVVRGTQSREVVEAINASLLETLPLTELLTCYHDDADNCACRKPKPGLLLEGAEHHGIDLLESFMVGDRWRDVEAGHRAGCRTIWLDRHYAEALTIPPDRTAQSLAEATEWILSQPRRN
jgi:D-glycero-D-manno-heptose 1,7-bisphosphate phosphatase